MATEEVRNKLNKIIKKYTAIKVKVTDFISTVLKK